jgi:hypothetical protein
MRESMRRNQENGTRRRYHVDSAVRLLVLAQPRLLPQSGNDRRKDAPSPPIELVITRYNAL